MQVSVFTAPTCSPETTAQLTERLAGADACRANSMGSAKRRAEFVSGRLLVRQGLAAIYGERSGTWTLETQASGALRLNAAPDSISTAISLSHSHGRVALGLADTPALGLDIELVRPRRNIAGLAGQVLHPNEMQQFSRLDVNGKTRFFYAKWVLKEALGKALGCGINYPMRDFLLEEDKLIEAPQAWIPDTGVWAFSHTLLGGGYALGLAWEGETADHVSIQTVEIRI